MANTKSGINHDIAHLGADYWANGTRVALRPKGRVGRRPFGRVVGYDSGIGRPSGPRYLISRRLHQSGGLDETRDWYDAGRLNEIPDSE